MAKKYSLKNIFNFSELYQRISVLELKQQLGLVALALLVFFLLILLPFSCASSKVSDLQGQLNNYGKISGDIERKLLSYQASQQRLDSARRRVVPESQVQLRVLLDKLAKESQIPNIDSITEREITPGTQFKEIGAEVRLTQLSLSQILEFLRRIDDYGEFDLRVQRISQLKPNLRNRDQFEIRFEVSTIVSVPKEAGAE